jgi:hypothetical protein
MKKKKGVLKKATKNLKATAKKAVKTVKVAGKKVILVNKKLIGALAKNAPLAPLLPFKPVMLKVLKNKGIKLKDKNLTTVAFEFFKNVAKPASFDSYDDFEQSNIDNYIENGFDPVITPAIISAVLKYVKGLIDKKKSGAKLSATEEVIVEQAESIKTEVKEEAKEEAQLNIGKLLSSPITIILILVIIFAFVKGK